MKIDLVKMIKKYGGKWVSLDEELSKVLVSGKDAEKVYKKAKKLGQNTPNLFKVPTKLTAYIGFVAKE